MVIVGEAHDGKEALQLTGKLAPEILVLDLSLPDVNGVEVVSELCLLESPTKVVAISISSVISFSLIRISRSPPARSQEARLRGAICTQPEL